MIFLGCVILVNRWGDIFDIFWVKILLNFKIKIYKKYIIVMMVVS